MNQKTELESLAQEVINKSKIPSENYGSVVLVLMFVSIVLTAIRILQECHKNKDTKFYGSEIRSLGKKRGWFTKMRLKKIIKQQLKTEDYKKYKDDIVSAILDVAENLTDEQMSTIIETEV
jgi:S-adenosylmethionine synthetase